MLDIRTVAQFVQDYGVVDFGAELEDDAILWFKGKNDQCIIISPYCGRILMSVWDNEECSELINEFGIGNIDELDAYLDKYALINKTITDTTMIDIYVKLIKEKLTENNISLNFEECNQAEKLIIRRIEGELAKIVKFLR